MPTYEELIAQGATPPAASPPGGGLTYEQLLAQGAKPPAESDLDFLKPEAKNRPRPTPQSATANDETVGDEDLATPASKRVLPGGTHADIQDQFNEMRRNLETFRTKPAAAINVLGNAAVLGAGPAITAAGSKLASFLPGQAPVNYDEARAANQRQLEADRATLGGLGTATAETVGGLAPGLLLPEAKAAQALGPVARGAIGGAQFGALQGAGESLSRGDTEHLARNALVGAGTGAVAGAALGGTLGRIAERAASGDDAWLVKDVLGNDVKTQANPTERKVLADDEADLKHTLANDPSLRKQVSKARGGDPAELQKLSDAIEGRKQAVTAPYDELYDHFDEASPQHGFRVGDMEEALLGTRKGYEKVGGAKVRNAIDSALGELRQYHGSDHVVDLNSPQAKQFASQTGVPLDKLIAAKKQEIATESDPTLKSKAEAELAGLLGQFGKETYNPNKIIPTKEAREIVTNLQGAVHDALGGFEERTAWKKARIVLQPVQESFNAHLNTGDPELVGQIRDMNRKYSAYRNIEDVVKQRLNLAKQQDTNVQKSPASFRAAMRALPAGSATLAFATGHPVMGTAMLAGAAAPEVARGSEIALSRLIAASKKPTMRGDLAGLAADAIAKGVPRSVVLQFAGSAVGGELHKAAEAVAP